MADPAENSTTVVENTVDSKLCMRINNGNKFFVAVDSVSRSLLEHSKSFRGSGRGLLHACSNLALDHPLGQKTNDAHIHPIRYFSIHVPVGFPSDISAGQHSNWSMVPYNKNFLTNELGGNERLKKEETKIH